MQISKYRTVMFFRQINLPRFVQIPSKSIDQQCRHLWESLNIVWNRLDEERLKEFGPDRTCAEWVLRNGGKVLFTAAEEFLDDYNLLPPEGSPVTVAAIDGTNSSINHHGFNHLLGCKSLHRIILHRCDLVCDQALVHLQPVNGTLKHLQVTACHNLSEDGLMHLKELSKLETLVLGDLMRVKDLQSVATKLRVTLTKCKITVNK